MIDRSNFKSNGGIRKLGFLGLVVFVALFSSCNDDAIIAEDCIPHTEFFVPPPEEHQYSTQSAYLFTPVFPAVGSPSFNPHNSDEIVYRKQREGFDEPFDIVKYNIRTGISRTLTTGNYN